MTGNKWQKTAWLTHAVFLLLLSGKIKGKGEAMTRITISLRDPEKTALRALSEIEFRDPRQQAALIIRQELQRRGLLDVQSFPSHVDTSPLNTPKTQTTTKRKPARKDEPIMTA